MKTLGYFLATLTILFVAFKLAGIITWNWYFVFGIITIPISVIAVVFLLVYLSVNILKVKDFLAKATKERFKKCLI